MTSSESNGVNGWQTAPLACRGVRGATTVTQNSPAAILEGTRELLEKIIGLNEMRQEDVASVFFTTTADLNSEYPAVAARQLGWTEPALMCSHEMAIPNGLPMCIRVLIHWNTTRAQREIQHVYLNGAVKLRPDRKLLTRELAERAQGGEKS